MFAIELSEDNLPQILQTSTLFVAEAQIMTDLYFRSPRTYYFIKDYFDRNGRQQGWGILPEFVLKDFFEYDPDKIKTDWDQIVRKPTD